MLVGFSVFLGLRLFLCNVKLMVWCTVRVACKGFGGVGVSFGSLLARLAIHFFC